MQPFYEKKEDEFHCFFSKDLTFPAHLHHAAELILIQEGSMEVTVSGQTKILRENEIALIFPDIVHSYMTQDFSGSILCIFSPSLTTGYYHMLCQKQLENPFFSSFIRDTDLLPAFQYMLQNNSQSPSISEAWLNLILAYLLSETSLLPRSNQYHADIGYQLISYISTHFQEPLTLDKIAQELHFNKYYVSRVFSGRLHCSFHEYLNRLRLDYAARLLRETDRSIMEIWQEAGFESQKTFNRTFRSCYRMTPSEYRGEMPSQPQVKEKRTNAAE